jgi:hypothetical protein
VGALFPGIQRTFSSQSLPAVGDHRGVSVESDVGDLTPRVEARNAGLADECNECGDVAYASGRCAVYLSSSSFEDA